MLFLKATESQQKCLTSRNNWVWSSIHFSLASWFGIFDQFVLKFYKQLNEESRSYFMWLTAWFRGVNEMCLQNVYNDKV